MSKYQNQKQYFQRNYIKENTLIVEYSNNNKLNSDDTNYSNDLYNSNIAICYFGMTRSLKKVYESHLTKLFDVLKKNNINYEIFMHTWKTDKNIVWNTFYDIPNDYEYIFPNFKPTYYQIDNQDDFLESITFSDYFYEHLYDINGNSKFEWHPQLLKNHLCALESQKRVTDMVINTNKEYDFVIFIRPDVELISDFSIDFLKISKNEISIPDYDHNEGYNDRFAIIPFINYTYYGKRIDEIKEFRKNYGRIVSEKYVKYILFKYFKNINFIDFKFDIIRS
jgi:hypothetical protein